MVEEVEWYTDNETDSDILDDGDDEENADSDILDDGDDEENFFLYFYFLLPSTSTHCLVYAWQTGVVVNCRFANVYTRQWTADCLYSTNRIISKHTVLFTLDN